VDGKTGRYGRTGGAKPLKGGLYESEHRFRLLVESVLDYGIFLLDPQGRISSWNRGAERIKGYSEADVLGKHFSLFYTPEDVERRYPEYELTVAAREGRYEDEGWRVRKDGSRFWANVVITALHGADGELVGFAKVTRDLTERKRMEAELESMLARERQARQEAERLAEEVQQQARVLTTQTSELEAASRAKSEFLANMSHELRTPINAIIGYVDLLEMGISGPVTEQQRAQLERIRASGQHLVGLIDEILDLAKAEAGRLNVEQERARAADAVAAALLMVEPQAAQKRIGIRNSCAEDTATYFIGDEDRVRQILGNLLSNAVKFTDPGGEIHLSCGTATEAESKAVRTRSDHSAYIRVQDTGIGVPTEQIENIFHPFTQVDQGHTRSYEGTGLGLTISLQLARLMGGDLTAASEPGAGSTFTLWLPTGTALNDAITTEASPGQPHDLAVVGEVLQAEFERVIEAYAKRLRADPHVPGTDGLSEADLRDHSLAFIADLAQTLIALEKSTAAPERLFRDGSEIQRVIAYLHGGQRAQLGWTPDAVRREYQILREEVCAAVRRAAPPDAAIDGALHLLQRFLDRAERTSLRSLRRADGR
jgi:PAS domain S-box-containing protein